MADSILTIVNQNHPHHKNSCTSRPDSQYSIKCCDHSTFFYVLVGGSGGHRGGASMMIDLYAKYTETYQRLRPPNTLQPVHWNDLPPWLQAVWVEMAMWLSDQPIELTYSPPEDQEHEWQ